VLGTIRGRVGFEGGKGVLIFLVDGRRHSIWELLGSIEKVEARALISPATRLQTSKVSNDCKLQTNQLHLDCNGRCTSRVEELQTDPVER
jgi:hypothetical protein